MTARIVSRLLGAVSSFQILRFAMVGGALTILAAGIYWMLAALAGYHPMIALLIAYVIATGAGYVLHSRFSFRGHGSRDRQWARTANYFVTAFAGLCLNQLFVWVLVQQLQTAEWVAIIPMIFVTPMVIFLVTKYWVFA